jgi:hypothetical protein
MAGERIRIMDDSTNENDLADNEDELLADDISDEALEAAGMERAVPTMFDTLMFRCCSVASPLNVAAQGG